MHLTNTATASIILGGLALVFVIISYFGDVFTRLTEKRSRINALRIVVLAILCIVTELTATILLSLDEKSDAILWAIKILKRLSIIAKNGSILYASIIFLSFLRDGNRMIRACQVTFVTISVLLTLLLVVDVFAEFSYSVNDDGLWQRETFFALYYAFELLMLVIDLIFLIKDRKSLGKRRLQKLLILIVVCLVCGTLGLIYEGVPFFPLAIIVLEACFVLWVRFAMNAQIKEQREIIAQKENEIVNLRDISLRQQISPHFIYNALTAIRAIDGNPDLTRQAISDFGMYLRYNLNVINEQRTVSFEKELEHIQAYQRIEQLRFGGELEVIFETRVLDFVVPQMSVQMLVENAVKHGVSGRPGGGRIRIVTTTEEENIKVCVIDNGVGFEVEKAFDDTHVGLKNLRNRLEYTLKGRLEIKSKKGEGTTATIILPKWTAFGE